MKDNHKTPVEFDFDANMKKIIEIRPVTFKNFCKRYPNNMELGARLRELVQEERTVCPVCERKKATDVKDASKIKLCPTCTVKLDWANHVLDAITGL